MKGNEESRRKKAIDALIQKSIEKGWISPVMAAVNLRETQALTKDEEYSLVKAMIIGSWHSFSATEAETKKILQNTENLSTKKDTDRLIIFAIDNVENIGFETIAGILGTFGTKNTDEAILPFIVLMKLKNRGMLFFAKQTIRNNPAPEGAIEYLIQWAREDGDIKSAIEISSFRKKPGLTPLEIETFFVRSKEKGFVSDCITLANMRENPGITTSEIEDLVAATVNKKCQF